MRPSQRHFQALAAMARQGTESITELSQKADFTRSHYTLTRRSLRAGRACVLKPRDESIVLSLGNGRFREAHGPADGADGVHGQED